MRALPLLLLVGACQDLTSLTPDRVPPPDREVLDEGSLDERNDPCGALDVDAPRRLSATQGDSDGVRMAVLPRPGGEAWVGVAWLEHGAPEPEPTAPYVAVQLLLDDGVPLGDTWRLAQPSPEMIDLVARPGTSSFILVSGDLEQGSSAWLVSPEGGNDRGGPIVPVELEQLRDELAGLDRPSLAVGQDWAFVAGLEHGAADPRAVRVLDVTIGEADVTVTTSTLARIQASEVAIASNGSEAWLAWNSDDTIWGAALTEQPAGQWTAAADADRELGFVTGPMRRAHGTAELAVAMSSFGAASVARLDDTGWAVVGSGASIADPGEPVAATRGESGSRWALARTWRPGDGGPAEIRVERFRPDPLARSSAGEGTRITTDLQESGQPEIVAVDAGYLVAWSDRMPDDQTDVFVAMARCHATTSRPTP